MIGRLITVCGLVAAGPCLAAIDPDGDHATTPSGTWTETFTLNTDDVSWSQEDLVASRMAAEAFACNYPNRGKPIEVKIVRLMAQSIDYIALCRPGTTRP